MSACASVPQHGPVAGTKLGDAFFRELARLGERHKTDPEVFLTPWCLESDLDPSAVNSIGARGLNQMMPETLKGLGAPANYETLPGEEQLPWIERLIRDGERLNGGPFKTAARYYHSNAYPATMVRGNASGTVVYAADAPSAGERRAYEANKCLDANGDGRVTLGDLETLLSRYRANPRFAAAFERLARAKQALSAPAASPKTPSPRTSPSPGPSRVAAQGGAAAGGLFMSGLLVGAVGLVVARIQR